MTTGLHFVSKRLADGTLRWHVYAWRGGPKIYTVDGSKPKATSALTDLAAEARHKFKQPPENSSISAQIAQFKASPEYTRTSASTQANYRIWLGRFDEEFGDTTLRMWQRREMRGEALDWRDKWRHQPRSADEAIKTANRLMNWIVDRGRLPSNILAGIEYLYECDRSDIIWEAHHFAQLAPFASVEVNEGIDLAAATGLRRGDLVRLRWDQVGEHAIIMKTGKSRGRKLITVPLIPEAKAVMARIRARYETEMASRRPSRRKPLPETVLSNSYWRSWEPGGFGSRFNDAKRESGIEVNLHDLRGTFATRLMLANLTDQEIADILGWDTKDVAQIRAKYVSQARVVIELGKRIAAAKTG